MEKKEEEFIITSADKEEIKVKLYQTVELGLGPASQTWTCVI